MAMLGCCKIPSQMTATEADYCKSGNQLSNDKSCNIAILAQTITLFYDLLLQLFMAYDFEPLWTNVRNKMLHPQDLLLPNACASSVPDAVRRFGSDPHPIEIILSDYVLGASQNSINVERKGDVLLGVFIQGDIQGFHTKIHDDVVHTNKLARNGFYPVLPKTFLPMICLAFHEVRLFFDRQAGITSDISLRFAFGYLSSEDRRALCIGMNNKPVVTEVMNSKQLIISAGMGNVAGPYVCNDPAYTHLPRYLTLPGLKEKIKWQHTINEELMQKTWHPDRLTKWCLDIQELVDMSLVSW